MPYSFQPGSGKYAGEYCNGIMLHVTNKHLFHPVKTGWLLMKLMMDHYPDKIQTASLQNQGKSFRGKSFG